MKLATTTLIGPDTLELLDDALASVAPFVDLCILIPTMEEWDMREVLRCAKRAGLHGDRVLLQHFGWCDDFSAARNFALDAATQAGADWSLILDTDERYTCDAKRLRALLDPATALGAYYVTHASGSYKQARLVKLPCPIRYSGRTHEAFPAYQMPTLTLAADVLAFSDVPKTPEQLEHKLRRDLGLLEQMTREDALATRGWFYLGETKRNLGDPSGALMAYDACSSLGGWDEEGAFACYRAAECLVQLGLMKEAVRRCAIGLSIHPAFGELAWLAGWCCYQLGWHQKAICWAAMAASVGLWDGVGRGFERIGFKHLPGLFEGPYDVMAHAWAQLGYPGMSGLARSKADMAKAARTGERVETGRDTLDLEKARRASTEMKLDVPGDDGADELAPLASERADHDEQRDNPL